MEGDQVAVVCVAGLFVARAAHDDKVVAVDGHCSIVTGGIVGRTHGYQAGEGPAQQVRRIRQGQAPALLQILLFRKAL